VKKDGWALTYASEELRADKDVVLAAVKKDGWALTYASEELRTDREFVLAAVKHVGSALNYASKELRADRNVVLAAVKQSGWALKFASEDLRADREVVLAAVKQDGLALKFASKELRNDWSLRAASMVPFFALALEHPEATQSIALGLATSAIVMHTVMENGFSLLSSAAIAASSGVLVGASLFKYRPHDIKNSRGDDVEELDVNEQGPALD